MPILSVVRMKCYLILQGLERSLKDSLFDQYDVEAPSFLTAEEQERSLGRLRQDMEESAWGLDDVRNEDLLPYLDLGDLVALLNRHQALARQVSGDEIGAADDVLRGSPIHAIRKRVMHAGRPLEEDDLSSLIAVATQLPQVSPNLNWKILLEGLHLSQTSDAQLDLHIPTYWEEDSKILHNLPSAEFDDTGFIGRENDRRRLKRLLESDHSVTTVVGVGGVGKTALALRVCHDILDDPNARLDRIIWVSLKAQYLTADGIRQITHAVDTTDSLIEHLLGEVGIPMEVSPASEIEQTWETILEPLRGTRTLLVIDNLETLGSELRDLAIQFPRDSKLLLTSRVGLVEIELRYDMPDLSTKDASKLLRNLGLAYNYTAISRQTEGTLNGYSQRLHHNPLLIKWFVHAVGQGASPNDVLSKRELRQALHFCWDNVYSGLGSTAATIVATLLAARRALSQAQLQEILRLNRIPLLEALQELHRSNIVDKTTYSDDTIRYHIGSLVHEYLSQFHPATNSVMTTTRKMLQQWQFEQERSAIGQNTYRYDLQELHIENGDQRIAAPHLRNAVRAVKNNVDEEKTP